MCGLFSLISDEPIALARIKKATDAIKHRGPDGEGFWISADKKAALGHRRLSIVDLSTGQQPLRNEDKTLHAVVNGELYGDNEIRKALIAKGHRFETMSDSEIVLHLYEEYGLDFTTYLRGEFAVIIYDEKKNTLIAARDRFGIKPLCYARDRNNSLYLASEAKSILAAGLDAEWDEDAFYHACTVQYVPTDRTLFKNIRQLPPGHILIFKDGIVDIRKYWDLDFPEESGHGTGDDADYIAEFKHLFEESVRLRLRSDVPVCAHLSGGIDSSAVAGFAAQAMGAPLHCFTVGFDQPAYDEYPIAAAMAEKMGSPLHRIPVTADDMINHMPDAVYYSEGLSINGHLVGKYLLNKSIRAAGFKVALTGEGADEVLAGYPHFREDLILKTSGNREKLETLYAGNAKLAGVFLAHGDMLPMDAIEKTFGFMPSFLKAKASLGFRIHQLLADDFSAKMKGRDVFREILGSFDVRQQMKNRHDVNISSYLWTKLTLANYILRTLGDGCEMAHGIEGRLPFLDHKLFEFLRTLPMHLKIRDMTEKYILREAAKPVLTETLYKRQKHPFIAPPVGRNADDKLRNYIQDKLRSQTFQNMGFFDAGKTASWLDKLAAKPEKEQIAAEPVLMTMLTASLIHEKFGLGR